MTYETDVQLPDGLTTLEAEALSRALLSPPDCDREAAEDILNLLLNGE